MAVVASADLAMVSSGVSTVTAVEHTGSVPPTGQLLAGAAVVITVLSTWSPRSGLLTVTEPVMVTVSPTPMSPVHTIRPEPITTIRLPDVAAASPL